jgi:hypothetical protein
VVVKLSLRIAGAIASHEVHIHPPRGDVVAVALTNPLVPAVVSRFPDLGGQVGQQIVFCFHAQDVHVPPRVELMAEIAVHVETGDQQVMNALEQRVIQEPGRLRRFAHEPLIDRSAVGMTINGQRGVGVRAGAVPEQAERAIQG